MGHTAQIRMKRKGLAPYTESMTFDRKQAAAAWLREREAQLSAPGAFGQATALDPTLAETIDRYISESEKEIGRTKAQVLRTIKKRDIAALPCSKIDSSEVVSFIQGLDVEPQTRGNYLSHLSSIFAIAKPAWRYPLERQAVEDAVKVLRRLGAVRKGGQRDRRPTLPELDAIMEYFVERSARRPDASPMPLIIAFAIFSTRRQEEITRITWADLDVEGSRIMVRNMKNPGQKIGNDIWCDLVPEALRLIQVAPRIDARIFPYGVDAISTAFTRAMKFLTIEDLHFHDLRHEGISRLFEMGWQIPRVAAVSGHRSWQSLQHYTHVRQVGDKLAGCGWVDAVASGSGT